MMYMHHMVSRLLLPSEPEPLQPQALIEVCLCHHSRRAARAVTRIFDDALLPAGLQASQFNILAVIAARDPTSAGTVADLLAMDRTTLSRNLKPLKEMGYITAEGGAGRRPDILALTREGSAAFSRASVLWRTAQSQMTQRLGSNQASILLQALEAATRAAS
jgi:DNA-binding MarR family transcriptional regulator